MRRTIFACAVLLLMALAACTGNTETGGTPRVTSDGGLPAESGAKEISLEIFHSEYRPSRIEVSKGDTVRISAVTSKGTSTHNHGITIDEYGINTAVTTEDKNSSVVVEFTADKAGEFKIYCKPCLSGPFGEMHPPIKATLVVK